MTIMTMHNVGRTCHARAVVSYLYRQRQAGADICDRELTAGILRHPKTLASLARQILHAPLPHNCRDMTRASKQVACCSLGVLRLLQRS